MGPYGNAPFGVSSFASGARGMVVENPITLGYAGSASSLAMFTGSTGLSLAVSGGNAYGFQRLISSSTMSVGDLTFSGVAFGATNGAAAQSDGVVFAADISGKYTFSGCTFPPQFGVTRATAGLASVASSLEVIFKNFNNDPTYQERYTYGGQQKRDNAVFKRGPSSIRFDCWYSANPLTYSRTIQVAAGQTINVRGSTRYNATYGTATPPKVTLSGLGITAQVFTDPATGTDTWHDYSLTATNPNSYPGEFTLTYQGQSAANSTGAYCWFDGVPDSPWIDSVRHYGYQFDSNAYRTVNPYITMSEASVAALTGIAIDHVAHTITLTSNQTTDHAWHRAIWDLVQNQGKAVHITEAGANFTTSYSIVVSNCTLTGEFTTTGTVSFVGTGAVVGRYVDSAGAHVSVAAPALVNDSQVRLYNVTDGAQLLNTRLTADGLVFPTTWTADKVIELRADKFGKRHLKVLGVLGQSGLTFLDVQEDDTAETLLALDGSTMSEFIPDAAGIQVEINDGDNRTQWGRLYCWWQHYQQTADGIASDLFGRFTSTDGANFFMDRTGSTITIRNNKTDPLVIDGGYLETSDGSVPFDLSGGTIFPIYGKVFVPPSYATDTAAAVVAGLPAPLVLDNGEQLFTVKIVGGQPKYLSRG